MSASSSVDELQRLLSAASAGDLLKAQRYIGEKLTPECLQAWNQTASPLLRLPRELRDQILTEVLVDRHDVEVPCREDSQKQGCTAYAPPALLQANRQLRQEAAEIYYTKNVFQSASDTLYEWLPSLPLEHRNLINTVHFAGKVEADLQVRDGSVWTEIEGRDSGYQVWIDSRGAEHEI
ncbi:hypothetical protein LTR85_010423 [Meristemomyces frigidus]|nr:hypothetical protein LTR85_010423 [Meristemomyces frigidus]